MKQNSDKITTELKLFAKADKVHDEVFPKVTDTRPKLKPAGAGA